MIAFTHVSKQYGRHVLFVEASFQLNPGEKVGLVGPNGAEETTLLKMVAGVLAPDSGQVKLGASFKPHLYPGSYVEYVAKTGHEAPGVHA